MHPPWSLQVNPAIETNIMSILPKSTESHTTYKQWHMYLIEDVPLTSCLIKSDKLDRIILFAAKKRKK